MKVSEALKYAARTSVSPRKEQSRHLVPRGVEQVAQIDFTRIEFKKENKQNDRQDRFDLT
jgi:hypothetical protein